jgi:Tol biopolymer transport system component
MIRGVPMPVATGTRVGPYEIVGWLGAGGMGEVYRARDPRLGREVAIKLIPETFAKDASRLHRFEQEARAAGQLNHPNILTVYDVGTHQGAPYVVSELLEGESLRSRLREAPPARRKAIDYARQIAEGLAAAHDKGIVHRDLKPDNIFVTREGRVKILDFGLAKLTQPADEVAGHAGPLTETGPGTVLGTAGYMSPEQVRGEIVDHRSDIFSVGAIVYEMVTGHPPFIRGTAAETMAAILKEDPPDLSSATIPPAVVRIVTHCLEKAREARFQAARDLAFDLESLSETSATASPALAVAAPRRWRTTLAIAVVLLGLFTAVASWLTWYRAPLHVDAPLANAQFTRLTDWEGTEGGAEISPDGRFVAFLADKDGQFDIWLTQVGTGYFRNLTADIPALQPIGPTFRKFGFSGDGTEIWFSPETGPSMAQMIMPLMGGTPRAFLDKGATAPSWSPDGTRLTYFKNEDGDPLFVADRAGADARQVLVGMHNHNPVWSSDGQWIYFARGLDPTEAMDVWRVRPSGESPERLTEHGTAVNFLAPLDTRTLLYVARAADRSGPWLWALDVERKETRRVSTGLGQYTSVSASRDGRRVVATVANPTASLWRVPLLDRQAEDRDVRPYPLPTSRALAPRFAGTSLFYLSFSLPARGTGDGLWRIQDGQASEISTGADGGISEPPAVSPDGSRVAIIVRREGKRRLVILSADGRSSRTLAPSLDIQGTAGQGTADWSPDGTWIVTSGRDVQGPGLFKIPVDSGEPVRLVTGRAVNPVWSPDGNLIVYAGKFFTGQVELLGVRPDGTPVELSPVRTRPGGYRFLPNGRGLVYLPFMPSLDFWLVDFTTKTPRQLTRLSNQGALGTFDVTPDGKAIVFDRSRENSDIVLIDLPKR